MFKFRFTWFCLGFAVSLPAFSQQLSSAPSVIDLQSAFFRGEFEKAETGYKQLLVADSANHTARAGLVRVYLKQGKVTDARSVLIGGGPEAERDSDWVTARGELLFREGMIGEAERDFLRATALPNPQPRAFLGLARVYRAASLYARARTMLDKAYRLLPQDPEIRREHISGLRAAEKVKELDDYLAGPNNEDKETRAGLVDYADFLHKRLEHRGECRLADATPAAQIQLWPMYTAHIHYGYGLETKVNGKRSVLQLDTGASGIFISRKLANKAGVKAIAPIKIHGLGDDGPIDGFLGYADSIQVGGLEFRDCLVEVAQSKKVYDEQGLIGADVFEDFLVDLDFATRKMVLSPLPQRPGAAAETHTLQDREHESPVYDRYIAPEMQGWTKIFRFGHDLLVPTRVSAVQPKLFLLDTGAFRSLVAKGVVESAIDKEAHLAGLSGKVKDVEKAPIADLEFAGFKLPGRDLHVIDLSKISNSIGTELGGIFGFEVLQLLRLQIDYRDGLIKATYDPSRLH